MYFVDTHCHLDLFPDIQKKVSVEDQLPIKTITVTNSPTFFTPNRALFSQSKNIRVALGLHPELISTFYTKIDIMEKHIGDTRYIGEIGLDGSKDFIRTFDLQKKTLRLILEIIKTADNKVLTVHTRNSAKDAITLLYESLNRSNNKVILHWYSGNTSDLKKALDYGYYFSINHKMLLSSKAKELLTHIPMDRLLTETDSPFTFDNQIKNRISSLSTTIKGLSEVKKCGEELMKATIYTNFKQLLAV